MLILLAPGITLAETEKVFLGRGDSAFTAVGLEQVADAAETLSPYQIDQAYSSGLYRAQETLRAVLKANHHPMPWHLAEELRERSGGSYEGRPFSDIRKGMSPKAYKVWERDPCEAPLLGESLIDVEDRLRDWYQIEVAPRLLKNETVLIVSHPDTIKVLISLARGDDLTDVTGIDIEHGLPYFFHGSAR